MGKKSVAKSLRVTKRAKAKSPWLLSLLAKFSATRLQVAIALVFLAGVSLCLRILPSYDRIFTDLGVKLATNDAYRHMRIVDNLVHNFPSFSFYDPYFVHPGTTVIGGSQFFDWLLASSIWVIGLGSPTQATVDTVGAYIPVVLAALLVVPVYFLGKVLFNRWTGIFAATMIAILPGELLGRSILGGTDHHIAETLLSTVAMLFLILAVKAVTPKSRRICVALSGLVFGMYLLTWAGGLLFILIVGAFAVIRIVINHLRGESSMTLAATVSSIFLLTLVMNYSDIMPYEVLVSLVVAVAVPVLLAGLSHIMRRQKWAPVTFPATLAMMGVLLITAVSALYPSFWEYMGMFLPKGSTATTTMELQPMLHPQGTFTTAIVWGNFTTCAVVAPIALLILIVSMSWRRDASKLLLIIWSLVLIVLTLQQRRYAYYSAVNVSLLVAYLSCKVIESSARDIYPKMKPQLKGYLAPAITVLLTVLLLVPTNVEVSVRTASLVLFAPTDAWQSALLWMKDNTPEPFQGRDIYDEYIPFVRKQLPPTPDYGVATWWDYGYWVTRTARRVPNANPAQNAVAITRMANLFLAEGESYHPLMNQLDSKYMIIDQDTAAGKFYAIVSWGDRDSSEYLDTYLIRDNGAYRPVVIFYPKYYTTLVSRLYNFDGKATVSEHPVVITFTPNKTITKATGYTSYQEALDHVAGLDDPNVRIVGTSPFASPVPLDSVNDCELVYSSVAEREKVPEVKIFEYTGLGD